MPVTMDTYPGGRVGPVGEVLIRVLTGDLTEVHAPGEVRCEDASDEKGCCDDTCHCRIPPRSRYRRMAIDHSGQTEPIGEAEGGQVVAAVMRFPQREVKRNSRSGREKGPRQGYGGYDTIRCRWAPRGASGQAGDAPTRGDRRRPDRADHAPKPAVVAVWRGAAGTFGPRSPTARARRDSRSRVLPPLREVGEDSVESPARCAEATPR